MSTEILFLLAVVIDLLFLLLAFKIGKPYFVAAIIGSIVLANLTVGKFVTVFGYDITVGVIPFAGIFLATDIFGEYYGKKEAYKTIRMGLVVLLMMVLFGWLVAFFEPTEYAIQASDAISTVLTSAARITMASLVVYWTINSFDVWWYDKLKQKFSSRKQLWMRNIGSTAVSQFLDTVLFMSLAFVGTMPLSVLAELILTLYIAKLIIALIDTPFMYLSHYFRPAELKDRNIIEERQPSAHVI